MRNVKWNVLVLISDSMGVRDCLALSSKKKFKFLFRVLFRGKVVILN